MEKYLADNWIVLHSREERIILSFIETLLEEAKQEEREKNEKIQNAYGVYVSDTMDWVEPEEAYKHMTKTIDSISSL